MENPGHFWVEINTPYTPSVTPALGGGVHAPNGGRDLVPMPVFPCRGRRVNHQGGINCAHKLSAEDPDAKGITKQAMRTTTDGLLAAGKIKIETDGPPSKLRSRIVECRLVTREAWQHPSGWKRHGPDGRTWNNITRNWEYLQ